MRATAGPVCFPTHPPPLRVGMWMRRTSAHAAPHPHLIRAERALSCTINSSEEALCPTTIVSACSRCCLPARPAVVRQGRGGRAAVVHRRISCCGIKAVLGCCLWWMCGAATHGSYVPAPCPATCISPLLTTPPGVGEVQRSLGRHTAQPSSAMAAAAPALQRTLSTPRSSVDTTQAGGGARAGMCAAGQRICHGTAGIDRLTAAPARWHAFVRRGVPPSRLPTASPSPYASPTGLVLRRHAALCAARRPPLHYLLPALADARREQDGGGCKGGAAFTSSPCIQQSVFEKGGGADCQ